MKAKVFDVVSHRLHEKIPVRPFDDIFRSVLKDGS